MFDDDEILANEEVLYEGKPSFIFFCKNVIIGFILISFILGSAMTVISSISNMQTYTLNFVNRPMAGIVALVIYGIVFLILIWMVWNLIKWYNINYIVTDRRIITKTGVIRQNKSYVSFKNIQDIQVSQTIFQKILGVGTIEIMSAYDNSDVSLKCISGPKDIEEIIFDGMNNISSSFNQGYPNDYYQNPNYGYNPQNNIKGDYIKENYPDYNPEEEYQKGRYYDSLSNLSNQPLDSYNDNEIYYNDYHDPDELDETINRAVRDLDGNLKFKDDKVMDNNIPRGYPRSNITYQGHSIEGQYGNLLNNKHSDNKADYNGSYNNRNNYHRANHNGKPYVNPNRNFDNRGSGNYNGSYGNVNYNRGSGNYNENYDVNYNNRGNGTYNGNYDNLNEDFNRYDNRANEYLNEDSSYHKHKQENHYKSSNKHNRIFNNDFHDAENNTREHENSEKTSSDVLAKHARKFRKN